MQITAYFSTLDPKYAYSQINLDPETATNSNFKIMCGDMTGTHRFKTGFYGLTDMPAKIQIVMDYNLIGNTFYFLDAILIASKGSEEEHKQYVFN